MGLSRASPKRRDCAGLPEAMRPIYETGMTYEDFARWARTQTDEALRCDTPPSAEYLAIFDALGLETVEEWLTRFYMEKRLCSLNSPRRSPPACSETEKAERLSGS